MLAFASRCCLLAVLRSLVNVVTPSTNSFAQQFLRGPLRIDAGKTNGTSLCGTVSRFCSQNLGKFEWPHHALFTWNNRAEGPMCKQPLQLPSTLAYKQLLSIACSVVVRLTVLHAPQVNPAYARMRQH